MLMKFRHLVFNTSFFFTVCLFFSTPGNSQLLSDQYCQPGSVPKYNVVDEDEFWNIEANQDLINTYNIRTQAGAKEFVCTLSNPMNFHEDVDTRLRIGGNMVTSKSTFGLRDIVILTEGNNFFLEHLYGVNALTDLKIGLPEDAKELGDNKRLRGTYAQYIGLIGENFSISGGKYDYQISLNNPPSLYFKKKPSGEVTKIECRRNHASEEAMVRNIKSLADRNVDTWRVHQCISVCGNKTEHIRKCARDKGYRQKYVDFFID